MKILVTGGGGFIGTEICKQLLGKGHEVASLSRRFYPHLKELGVECMQGDLAKEAPSLQSFDAVIHTAAKAGVWGKKEDFYDNNYGATLNILKAARDFGAKYFVFTSSPSVVFGKEDIENGKEDIPYPDTYLSEYPRTKAMAEKAVLESDGENFKTLAIRPHLIWGEGDPHLVPRILQKARAGKLKIVGAGENLVDVIHVKNAAHAHILALEALAQGRPISGRPYFVGQERPVNLWEFINQILFQAGLEGVDGNVRFQSAYTLGCLLEKCYKILGINNPEPPMTRFVALQLAKSHYFSHQEAKEAFGYAPIVSIEQGLNELFGETKRNLKLISELE